MVRQEIWAIPLSRAEAFFREQPDVTEEPGAFRHGTCRITLKELPPREIGIWSASRVQLRMEGDNPDVSRIYHRFMIQFLTAGG